VNQRANAFFEGALLDKSEPKPLLEIGYSRARLLAPLLLMQVIGAALLWVISALFAGTLESSQYTLATVGVLGGALSYLVVVVPLVSKVIDPSFLKLFDDGTAIYKPLFKRENLSFSPDVRWTTEGAEVHFHDSDAEASVRSFTLPWAIKRDFPVSAGEPAA
jgi:hypothetical protein